MPDFALAENFLGFQKRRIDSHGMGRPCHAFSYQRLLRFLIRHNTEFRLTFARAIWHRLKAVGRGDSRPRRHALGWDDHNLPTLV